MNIFYKLLPSILILVITIVINPFHYCTFWHINLFPRYNNIIVSNDISAKIEIIRDINAVPHIFGKSKKDIIFGLGYAHAQERFWQMNFLKRIAQGRLSEIVGQQVINLGYSYENIGLSINYQTKFI